MDYQFAGYTVTATQTSTELKFVSLSPNGGILLDTVSLTAIPEPSTYALWAGAAGLVATSLHRRRQLKPGTRR
jgi:hypothetical protein